MEFNVKKYIMNVVPPTYLPAITVGLVLYVITLFYTVTNLFTLALLGMLGMSLYLLLFYYFGLDQIEKNDLKKIILSLFPTKI